MLIIKLLDITRFIPPDINIYIQRINLVFTLYPLIIFFAKTADKMQEKKVSARYKYLYSADTQKGA